jgi:hypothetical protein
MVIVLNVQYLGCYNGVDQFFLSGSSPNGEPIAATLHMKRPAPGKGHDEPIERMAWFNQGKTCKTASIKISSADGIFSRVKRICEYARYRTAR